MTEEAKARYDEDRAHYDVIRAIIQEEVKKAQAPTNILVKYLIVFASAIIGFVVGNQFYITGKFGEKADKNDTVTKLEYYQIEKDEHRMIKEIFVNPSRSIYIFDQINDNIEESLGFKLTNKR
ncbi:MAG: hypothetical protein WCI31_15980 [Prolixibacteraceae bacterium]